MKFCGNCGTKLEDTDLVCGNCGTPCNDEQTKAASPASQFQANPSQQPKKKTAKKRTPLIAAAIAVVVIVIVIIAATSGSKTIDLNDYMEITFEGYDGYGRVNAEFNMDEFLADWGNKVEFQSAAGNLTGTWSAAETMYSLCVAYTLDTYSGLSDGDKVTLTWKCNDTIAKNDYGVKLKYSNITKKVKNLKEVEEFDPFDYVTAEYGGADGYGYAQFSIDQSEDFMANIRLDYDKTDGLSNGDVITVTAKCTVFAQSTEEYFSQTYGKIPSTMEKTYTVEGLAALETFDPFEYINVSFSGVSPYGTAEVSVDYSRDEMNVVECRLSQSSDLSNGDTVTVTLSSDFWNVPDLTDYWAENYGVSPESLEKTYTVEGLEHYVNTLEDIPDNLVEEMTQQASDAFAAYVANEWDYTETYGGITYLGAYLLVPKAGFSTNYENIFYLVYAVNVVDHEATAETDDSFTYYTYTCYNNLVMNTDGEVYVDISDYQRPSATFSHKLSNYSKYSLSYRGYETINTLFNDCVTTGLESYTYESSVDAD